jgi:hypothetical protein
MFTWLFILCSTAMAGGFTAIGLWRLRRLARWPNVPDRRSKQWHWGAMVALVNMQCCTVVASIALLVDIWPAQRYVLIWIARASSFLAVASLLVAIASYLLQSPVTQWLRRIGTLLG